MKHLLYAKTKGSRLRELQEEFEAESDPLDATPELLLARAMLAAYLERTGEENVDLELASKLLESIGRAIKRMQDVQAQKYISRSTFFRVLTEIGRVVDHSARQYVHEEGQREKLLKAIADGWLDIQVA